MKTTFLRTLIMFLLIMASVWGCVFAENREMILVKTPYEQIDEDPIGVRIPSRPLRCLINEDGIYIEGYESIEILFYEIYDLNGLCKLGTNDAQEFISYILNENEVVEVRFLLSGFILKGKV